MSHPPRLKNFDYIGRHRYFLTFCTHERQPFFKDTNSADLVREQLVRTAEKRGVAVDAYCFMKDHVHLLVKGLEDSTDLRSFMNEFKQRSGWQFRCEHGRRLWQGSYYDHVLREEEGTASVVAYIVNNPYCRRFGEYGAGLSSVGFADADTRRDRPADRRSS